MPRFRLLSSLLLATLLAAPVAAQGCTSGTFWKRDTLPAVPTGLTGVTIVQGLCEGESAGIVFEMPATMPPQRITKVVAPWGGPLGVNGFQAALDVEVYDGVSFSGATATMGTQVFSLSTQATANMQVQSHALNELDTSTYNIVVGTAAPTGNPPVRRFAVCFRVDLNLHPTGTCATGYPANFFTDNGLLPGLTCNNIITPQRTSLIEIQGQGWRDAALASVSGFQLCPLYYSGVWCIRCCSEDAFPASYTTVATGCAGSLPPAQLLPASLPRLGTTLFVLVNNLPVNLGLMVTGTSNTTSTLGPLPLDMTPFGITNCMLRTSPDLLTTLLGGGGTASWSLAIPNVATVLGTQLWQQPFVFDPGLNPFGGTLGNTAALQVGN